MKPAFWARKAHKWIGLVIGVQALLWMCSGLYMTSISIDVIHGEVGGPAIEATIEGQRVRISLRRAGSAAPAGA